MGLFFPYGEMAVFKFENVLFDGVGAAGTGYVLGPSIFFKLCKYTDKVYIYLFTY